MDKKNAALAFCEEELLPVILYGLSFIMEKQYFLQMGAVEQPFPQIFTDFEQISADEQPKIICVNLL